MLRYEIERKQDFIFRSDAIADDQTKKKTNFDSNNNNNNCSTKWMLSTILWTDPRTDLSSFWWKKCGNENSISFFFIFYKSRKHFISSWLYCVCVFVSHLVCVLFVFMCSWSGCYLCSTISKLYRTWNTQLLILSLLFFFLSRLLFGVSVSRKQK